MTDEEAPAARDPRIFPKSSVGSSAERHFAQFELCAQLRPDEAFPVPKVDEETGKPFNADVLRQIAETLSVNGKRFAVIEHETAFEVRRLANNTPLKLFYRILAIEQGKPVEVGTLSLSSDRELQMWAVITEAFDMTSDIVKSYDASYTPEMRAEGLITYSYIHRRLFSQSAFKKAPEGGTIAIKNGLQALVAKGKLSVVPREYAERMHKTKALLYRKIED